MSGRTHPPTLLTTARRTIVDHALFAKGDRVLVAVSGGPDSMALLHVLARLRPKLGHIVMAHGVDHGLRAAAATELDGAEEFARTLDVPFQRTRVRVSPGGNLQARARAARYDALRDAGARAGACAVATAHHADDRAETLLLRLLRGAGPAGLAVLPPRAEIDALILVRPFIHARRTAIEAHLARHRVSFAVDPSNRDPRFLRARVRADLLPLMAALSPSIVEHLCALAEQLGRASEPDPLRGLPRATRDALARLARERSTRSRVFVGPGLVARYDRSQLNLVLEPSVPPQGAPATPTPTTTPARSSPGSSKKRKDPI
jgi:tRNA(Ile)-lysidine synthase